MTVVLVHGNPETDAIWDDLRTELGRDDVVALCPPGFGAPVPDGFGATLPTAIGPAWASVRVNIWVPQGCTCFHWLLEPLGVNRPILAPVVAWRLVTAAARPDVGWLYQSSGDGPPAAQPALGPQPIPFTASSATPTCVPMIVTGAGFAVRIAFEKLNMP